jgi:4-carboxymuconolactone decarboxylase
MTRAPADEANLHVLDDETRTLARLAAIIAVGDEAEVRRALAGALGVVRPDWVEEVLLQTHLFAGFPRSLNATREWRRASGRAAPAAAKGGTVAQWRERGERTCARVYGATYERLRQNIRGLHPELDEWMIVEGYGKVLSRPELDLARRELCIVAVCAAAGQDRQLHSHLHGALNVGVAAGVVDALLDSLGDLMDQRRLTSARLLWARVKGK